MDLEDDCGQNVPVLRPPASLIQCGMQIAEEALNESIKFYKEEFDEDIDRDHAQIMARNLVLFYLELEQRSVFQAASKLEEEEAPSDDPANG